MPKAGPPRAARGFLLVVTSLALLGPASAAPAETAPDAFTIDLQQRSIQPTAGIAPTLAAELGRALADGETRHVYLQFWDHPDAIARDELAGISVELLDYVGGRAWQAALRGPGASELLDDTGRAFGLRWLGPIASEDKLAPGVLPEKSSRRGIAVHLFSDVKPAHGRKLLEASDVAAIDRLAVGNAFVGVADAAAIEALSLADPVAWIEPVLPLGSGEADRARLFVQSNTIQQFDPITGQARGYVGDGVRVAVFENHHVGEGHPDLQPRVQRGDTDPWDPEFHTTAVAGLVAGSGVRSAHKSAHGSPWQYRGTAPAASIFTYDFQVGEGTTPEDELKNYVSDLLDAVNHRNVAIGANAWGDTDGCASGGYKSLTYDLDAAVAGVKEFKSPLIVVFSAGNDRDGFDDGSGGQDTSCLRDKAPPFRNYETLNYPKAAKNVIVVGAVDSANDRMTEWSNWGPTKDGRLKPDVVAGGLHDGTPTNSISVGDNFKGQPAGAANQQAYRASSYPYANYPGATKANNPKYFYGWLAMTSAAAATTSGAVAQLVEAWRDRLETEIDPLPATVRAMLAQTARDLDDATPWYNPGPDYASGYGVVQIEDAIDLIGRGQIVQGKVVPGRPDRFAIDVPAGTTSLKFTLAWDDPPPARSSSQVLVNDLDLYVLDPNGVRYRPWILDRTNAAAGAVQNLRDWQNNLEQVMVAAETGKGPLPQGTWEVVIDPYDVPEAPQRYGLAGSAPLRPAVDVMLVLDRSGSMTEPASAGMPDTKIETLRAAATQLVQAMRPNEGFGLGLVQFNQNVVPFPAGAEAALALHTSARAATLANSTIPSIQAGGRTSIGDGLEEATKQLATPVAVDHDRVVLLVTDGKENEPKSIGDVKANLIAQDVTVHVLGLGHGAGVDADRLSDLALDTGGSYRITADHVAFRKLFIETLADVVHWSAVTDPAGRLTADETATVPFTLAADETGALITVLWEGVPEALEAALVTPSGAVLDPISGTRGVHFTRGDRFLQVTLDPPFHGRLADVWAGTWQLRLEAARPIPAGRFVRYDVGVFAEGGARLELDASVRPLAGEPLQLSARLERDGRPLLGASVGVEAFLPSVALADLLGEPSVAFEPQMVAGDPVSSVDRKLRLLDGERALLGQRRVMIDLLDDGEHGDGEAGDGVYGNVLTATDIPGHYAFRAIARAVPAGARTTSREASLHLNVGLRLNLDASRLAVETPTTGEPAVRIALTPRDGAGRLLGPGHIIEARLVDVGGTEALRLEDHLDGRYAVTAALPRWTRLGETEMELLVDGRRLTELVLPTAGSSGR